jgi:hypothetical protein
MVFVSIHVISHSVGLTVSVLLTITLVAASVNLAIIDPRAPTAYLKVGESGAMPYT